MYSMLYLLPLISAALAFLFYLLGIQLLQRRLYRRRSAIAQAVAQQLGGDADRIKALRQQMIAPENLDRVKPLIETHVATFLNVKLQEKLPVIAMFASPEMLGKIKEGLLEEIDLLLPEVIETYAGNALMQLNPQQLMMQQAAALTPREINAVIRQAAGSAGIYAAAAGFLIGCVPPLLAGVAPHMLH